VKCINFIRKPKQYSRNSVALTVTEYVIQPGSFTSNHIYLRKFGINFLCFRPRLGRVYKSSMSMYYA